MNKLFQLTPISDPPKEDGWYTVYWSTDLIPNFYYFKAGKWYHEKFTADRYPDKYIVLNPGYMYLAPLAEPVEGMRWRDACDLPSVPGWYHTNIGYTQLEYIGDGIHGDQGKMELCWLNRNGGHVTKWLDESGSSSTPSAREAELERQVDVQYNALREENYRLRELIKLAHINGIEAGETYFGASADDRADGREEYWLNFRQQHNL